MVCLFDFRFQCQSWYSPNHTAARVNRSERDVSNDRKRAQPSGRLRVGCCQIEIEDDHVHGDRAEVIGPLEAGQMQYAPCEHGLNASNGACDFVTIVCVYSIFCPKAELD